jgi:RNA polymerase sigma factor (sigma-70 family)
MDDGIRVGVTALLAQQLRTDRSFERMYRRHVGDVYRYALAVLRNPADAEDVAQTTFMNAYRAFAAGERPRNAHNWLIAIAHNVCRQRFRQSARRPAEVEYDDALGEHAPEEPEGPTAADIQRALGQLAFNQRAALVMRELEGRSYAEISEILGISVAAVETLIFRARRALREQLEGTLTCHEAERAISREVDGRLPRSQKGVLRAHLRGCSQCQRFARSQRAQRRALQSLAAIPLPSSLTSLFGGGAGSAAIGSGVAIKAAAAVAAGTVATGVGYKAVAPERPEPQAPSRAEAVQRPTRAVAALPRARMPEAAAPSVRAGGKARSARTEPTKAQAKVKAQKMRSAAALKAKRDRRAKARVAPGAGRKATVPTKRVRPNQRLKAKPTSRRSLRAPAPRTRSVKPTPRARAAPVRARPVPKQKPAPKAAKPERANK